MSPNLRLSTPGLLLALCSGPALAEIPIDSSASISGYGTLGMVHSNYEEADFIGIPYQPRGATICTLRCVISEYRSLIAPDSASKLH
jgi:hypothetical protein